MLGVIRAKELKPDAATGCVSPDYSEARNCGYDFVEFILAMLHLARHVLEWGTKPNEESSWDLMAFGCVSAQVIFLFCSKISLVFQWVSLCFSQVQC